MQSELNDVQVGCSQLRQAWFWRIFCTLGGGFILMFWDRLRCSLTVASQLGDERRASVRPLFLGPSPCGPSSAVPKEDCLVVAAGWCCLLGSISEDQYPEPPACRIGTAASCDIFHLPFHPFPIATGLGRFGGVADVDFSFQPAQYRFLVEGCVCSTVPTLYTRASFVRA